MFGLPSLRRFETETVSFRKKNVFRDRENNFGEKKKIVFVLRLIRSRIILKIREELEKGEMINGFVKIMDENWSKF